jgi:hypothetical protein
MHMRKYRLDSLTRGWLGIRLGWSILVREGGRLGRRVYFGGRGLWRVVVGVEEGRM